MEKKLQRAAEKDVAAAAEKQAQLLVTMGNMTLLEVEWISVAAKTRVELLWDPAVYIRVL